MDRQNIKLEQHDRVWTLTFNRPEKHNALDAQTVREAHDALREVESEAGEAGGVLILQGAGDKAFLSGADISQLYQRSPRDALGAINQGIFTAVENFPWPVIAAVNGYALGGGFELAIACDLRVASETARFGFPETGLGIIPGAGGTQRLARLISLALAKELILTGEVIDARRALVAGLVSAVVAPPELMPAAHRYAEKILTRGPLALRMAKLAMNASSQAPEHAGLLIETLAQTVCFGSQDKAEGTRAFLEKRKPQFRGK
ncbi:MAG TPA: enoyl-CoA hydratase-related protein [Bryobacterales bacterium]|nr:enoyl-CoA hydratase-related protein [Bryobacterales bacterium]